MRLVGYCRVSTEQQSSEGHSLEAQAAKVATYCDLYDYQLVATISEQGSAKSLKRDGLQQAIEMIRAGEADGILITKLDRLTRSMRDFHYLLDNLFNDGKINAKLHSVEESLNTSTATGRMILNLIMTTSTWERETISERTSTVLQHKKKVAGKSINGRAPYGWRWSDAETRELVPVCEEQKVLNIMMELRNLGETYQSISDELDRRHLATKRGGSWTASTVRKIITNNQKLENAS